MTRSWNPVELIYRELCQQLGLDPEARGSISQAARLLSVQRSSLSRWLNNSGHAATTSVLISLLKQLPEPTELRLTADGWAILAMETSHG